MKLLQQVIIQKVFTPELRGKYHYHQIDITLLHFLFLSPSLTHFRVTVKVRSPWIGKETKKDGDRGNQQAERETQAQLDIRPPAATLENVN